MCTRDSPEAHNYYVTLRVLIVCGRVLSSSSLMYNGVSIFSSGKKLTSNALLFVNCHLI